MVREFLPMPAVTAMTMLRPSAANREITFFHRNSPFFELVDVCITIYRYVSDVKNPRIHPEDVDGEYFLWVKAWPKTASELAELQLELAAEAPPLWRVTGTEKIGGCFLCFPRGSSGPGQAGDRGWAAAALGDTSVWIEGTAPAPYRAGLLALREGALLEQAVRALPVLPDALLVDATGRDHPRRAGLALHLGAVLGLPTVGVTHRPLLARGDWPDDNAGASSPLVLEANTVGYWLRTRSGRRPLAVHAAWMTDAETAVRIVLASLSGARTPEPLRTARRAARTARAHG